jgi:hypothetical protein
MSQDRPTAAELVRAVRALLERETLPRLEGAARFHLRVSANVLEIVARELELGPQLDAEEHGRLRALLGRDGTLDQLNGVLAAQIRDGTLDARHGEVLAHVRETVRAKLRIAHPDYAEPR